MIVALLILFGIPCMILCALLFVPVVLTIDTTRGTYEIRQRGMIVLYVDPRTFPVLNLKVFGVRVDLRGKREPGTTAPVAKRKNSKNRKPFRRSADAWVYLLRGARRSLKLVNLDGTFDLCDVSLNAQLFPVLNLVNGGPVYITTNFSRTNYLKLLLEVKVYRLAWTIVRFFTKQ